MIWFISASLTVVVMALFLPLWALTVVASYALALAMAVTVALA